VIVVVVVEALVQHYHIISEPLNSDASEITAIFEHEYDTASQSHHDLIHEI
jgi:hypothetical protein